MTRRYTFFACPLLVTTLTCLDVAGKENEVERQRPDEAHPLSLQLQTLQRDLTDADYRAVLATMIPTDLAAEWQRVATPDNYLLFAEEHGGEEKVGRDQVLRRAWQRRKRIASEFLDVIRAAYRKRNRRPPFDDVALLHRTLASARRRDASSTVASINVRPLIAVPGSESQWPAFRGPTGQGTVFDARMPLHWSDTENVVWKVALPGRGHSSPVIWGERIFITAEGSLDARAGENATDRLLLCYRRSDGQLLWSHAAPKPAEPEALYWKNSFATSTPVTDGERAIVFFGNSGLLCCDLEGERLWHRDLGTFPTMHGPGSTPVLYSDLVILIQDQTRGGSVFAAWDKRSGRRRWRHARKPAACWSTPVLVRIGGRDELVFNGSHEVVSYDPATGTPLWRIAGTSREAIPMIASGGGLLYSFSGRNGPILAIRPGGSGDVTESHVVWRTRRGGPHVPTPAYHDGRLYIVSVTGIITCRNAKTGKELWQQRLRGRFSMSPLVVDDKLLLINESGTTFILECGPEFKALAVNDLDQVVLATPAVLDGRIYLRSETHLLCIGAARAGER